MQFEWLYEMSGTARLVLVAFAIVVLMAAVRYDKGRSDEFGAFVFVMTAVGFMAWSLWFCLGAFVKPLNVGMDFMTGR